MSKIKLILIFACFVGSLQAQTSEDVLLLTLEEAQEIALENSLDIKITGLEVDRAKAQVTSATAPLLPHVNGKISYAQYGKFPSTVISNDAAISGNTSLSILEEALNLPEYTISEDPAKIPDKDVVEFGSKFNVNAEVTLSQTIFNGVFLIGLRAANQFIELRTQQVEITKQQVLDNVKRTYLQVLAAKENIDVLEKNINNIIKLKSDTKALFDNGFAEEIDVDRLQLSINSLNSQLNQAARQVALAESLLKFQMGIDMFQPIELVGELESYLEEINYDFPKKGDFSNRAEIPFFTTREYVNATTIKLQKFNYLPSVVGFASIGSSAQRDKFNFFKFGSDLPWLKWLNSRYFGFEINVPIWDSFKTKGDVQYAKIRLENTLLEREKLFKSMDLEYENAKVAIIKAKEELNQADKNIELAEKIYKITQVKYKEGVGSSIEMTNAERDLYEAQANRLMSIYNLLIAKADIDKALGNL